jgi:glycoside hydrolase-like protein
MRSDSAMRRRLRFAVLALAMLSVSAEMTALASAGSLATQSAASKRPLAGQALVTAVECSKSGASHAPGCPASTPSPAAGSVVARSSLPPGASQCPDSGPGAACAPRQDHIESGTAAPAPGLPACPADAAKPALNVPGSCDVSGDTKSAPSAPAAAAQGATPGSGNAHSNSGNGHVRSSSLDLTADQHQLAYGSTTMLRVKSPVDVTGTPMAIEIFDQTERTLIGACAVSSDCAVAYTGKTGVHSFVAYVAPPAASFPPAGAQFVSNKVDVRWIGVGLVAVQPIVGPGQPITFAAFASENVEKIGYRVELWDAASQQELTYCAHGAICRTTLIEPASGVRAVTARIEPNPTASHAAPPVTSQSGAVYGIWLGVNLEATATSSAQGQTVSLRATANADLSQSAWSIYVLDQNGRQVGQPCRSASCDVDIPLVNNDATYQAVIGRLVNVTMPIGPFRRLVHELPGTPSTLDVQASSQLVKPTRIMWGVDSCQPLTQDPSGSTGMYPQVANAYGGAPDFWGRYLTTTYNCPGLSPAEISAAHAHHMGLLPIYNDYDCSAVQGYETGVGYAQAAAAQAVADGIPAGTGIAVDIEPPGAACPGAANVDSGFLKGWFDAITWAHYQPVFYGDASPGSAFQSGWCTLVAAYPAVAKTAHIWSFEPSLVGWYAKANAPGFSPNSVGCGGVQLVWQYGLSAGSTPNVDVDEVMSPFPLWFP